MLPELKTVRPDVLDRLQSESESEGWWYELVSHHSVLHFLQGVYDVLLERQQSEIDAYRREASIQFPPGFDFSKYVGLTWFVANLLLLIHLLSRISALGVEARQRLNEAKPATLGRF